MVEENSVFMAAIVNRVVEIRVDIIAVVRIIVLGVNTVNQYNGDAQQGNKATHFSYL